MQGMSTTNVIILAPLLRALGGVARLTPAEKDQAYTAITESDN